MYLDHLSCILSVFFLCSYAVPLTIEALAVYYLALKPSELLGYALGVTRVVMA